MTIHKRCQKCGEERLRTWDELSDDEREVVLRLPGSAEYGERERKTHQWCARCWYEEVHSETVA